MAATMTIPVAGTLGNVVGSGSDGVLAGIVTAQDPTKGLRKVLARTAYAYTDDGGVYVNETAPFNESTADDVECLPATPADDDAFLVGHSTDTFSKVVFNLTTDGVGTWDITWQYWDGTAWTNLSGVSDGSSGFVAGSTGWKTLTFTLPGDWATTEIDYVTGYWIRGVVDNYSSVTTPPQIGQGYVVVDEADAGWTDDLTDLTDAGTSDVGLTHPDFPQVGDGFYFGYSEKFCKVVLTMGTNGSATWTITWKYWDGSAWTALTTVEDDSSGFTAGTGANIVHFVPPSDWVANTAGNGPNGETGFFVVAEVTAFTSQTTAPLATRGWVVPLVTGASGIASEAQTWSQVSMTALTNSATNANSVFLLVNKTTGDYVSFTWTAGTAAMRAAISLATSAGDELLLIQVTEDGTTEFANASFTLRAA